MTVADLTERLVAIPSHDDETAAGDAVADWFETATVERDTHGNVFARQNPDGERQLAFVGHHDVVPPAPRQTTDDGGYAVERRGERLYGRGTADMVGSLAAAMHAVESADPGMLRGADLELCFVSFVGEEDGGVGCRAAVDDGFAPEYAVVGEGSTGYSTPGVTDVAVAHKGRRGSTLTVTGEAAHASEPEAGVNAAYRAADAVDAVRGLDAPTATVQGKQLAGSLAVTGVESGTAWNVIPESATVTVDERTVPGGVWRLRAGRGTHGHRKRLRGCARPARSDLRGDSRACRGGGPVARTSGEYRASAEGAGVCVTRTVKHERAE